MAHKLRHGLAERPDALLDGMVEVDESYYGGRGKPESRGRGMANANKSLLVLAVEKVAVAPGKGVKGSGFVAGRARLAILPRANAEQLGGFVRAAVTPGARLLTDDFKGYAGLGAVYQHQPTVQGQGKNAETQMPIIHVLFSNLKTWLNGTDHGVSAKHLPRYGREWAYRFNRRRRIDDLGDFVLSRAMARPWLGGPSHTAGAASPVDQHGLLTDDFKGYAGLGAVYQHQPTVQGQGKNAETQMPIIHVLFSNLDLAQRHLPWRQRQALAALWPGMGLSLQPPPADRRPRRLRPEPRHGPANHHIPPVDPRLATPGRTTCLNRIGTLVYI